MTDNTIKIPSSFANGTTIESMYQSYLSDLFEHLRDRGTFTQQDAAVVTAVFSAMVIAFKALRKEETVQVIMKAARIIESDWSKLEQQLGEVYQHLGE
ncbi:hypothetical protein OH460_08645 [Vibrio sp. Makdt]|uniref:hypothetical protein n=1 Tax=Vibrio sp. Makdt TaxID=2998828 RepID=UPI0022CDA5AE|nr:hypothetical protein [Vibrio sp. Makdt]MDA0152369.1 hypothetical protein [Vibrio sp. Makdt]